jgi:hypothetical protein
VHISVRYTPDFRQSVRLILYLYRKRIWALAIFGALWIVFGVAEIGSKSPEWGIILIAIGVVLIVEIPVLLWLRVYRNRNVLLSEAEVTLTSEGFERRTDIITISLTWDKLERIHELNDMWVFVANRLAGFGVAKRVLSRDQQAELAAFIEARGLDRRVKKMTPAQEAAYSLAYGIARAGLKPEVQAEYDRLVAERGPA